MYMYVYIPIYIYIYIYIVHIHFPLMHQLRERASKASRTTIAGYTILLLQPYGTVAVHVQVGKRTGGEM